MTTSREGLWEVSSRTIVYAVIGAALVAIGSQFSVLLPGLDSVSIQPAFAFVTFFGFAFGPIVGLATGLAGNVIGDQLGSGLLASWNGGVALGVVGLLAGVAPSYFRSWTNTPSRMLIAAAAGSALATVAGLLVLLTDVVLGAAADLNTALTQSYGPAVVSGVIAAVVLTPILLAAWQPVKERLAADA